MSPRKKAKPNPKAPGLGPAVTPAVSGGGPATGPADTDTPQNTLWSNSLASLDSAAPAKQPLQSKASRQWLSGSGTWRSKAPASIKSSKESIGVNVAGGAATELPGEEDATQDKDQTPAKFLSKRTSSKGNTIPTATTKLNVSFNGSVDQAPEVKTAAAQEPEHNPEHDLDPEPQEPNPTADDVAPPLPPDPVVMQKPEPAGVYGWRGWWSRPDGYLDTTKTKEAGDAHLTPLPGPTPSEEVEGAFKELGESSVTDNPDTEMEDAPPAVGDLDSEMKDAPPPTTDDGAKSGLSTSWFWYWNSAQNAQARPPVATPENEIPKSDTVEDQAPQSEPAPEPEPQAPTEPVAQADTQVDQVMPNVKQPAKPSGWAFWFSDKPKDDGKPAEDGSVKHVGEVAVYDTPSQSRPEAAQFNEEQQPQDEPLKEPPKAAVEKSVSRLSMGSFRGRPKVKDTPKETRPETPTSSKPTTPSKASPNHSPTRPSTAPAAQPAPKAPASTKQEPPNLIFPQFSSTYRLVQKPSYWQKIRQYFLGDEPAMPHLHINPAPPRIRKAVAIGIHGFFPAPIIQRVLGQPTGTSIRFATAARKAIDDWTTARGYTADVQQIALEGEGTVSQRVDTLWKLLLNRIEHVKEADFIMVACHSQGVPVAIMLIAKLIQFGCVSASRIGVCSMAGINMGPFKEFKTKYFGAIAAELFEFSDPTSEVSRMYLTALDEVLRYGVRILYVGSIDDQLVSLESSTFSTLSHPYLYRAVFIDGRIHAPDFLTHLVGFTLKLRNLGLPDHGLIRELSPALAGSLYGGEGHSRIYDDPHVYELAVQHALETTSLPIIPQQRPGSRAGAKGAAKGIAKAEDGDMYKLRVRDYDAAGASTNANPFFLPWAMRGLLEEDFVKRELNQEVEELLGMFEEWRPALKQLKDVKFRLEAVRSRL